MRLKIKQRLLRFLTRHGGAEKLAEMNREMHRQGRFRGGAWEANLADLRTAVPDIETLTVLDFGCGPKGGLRKAFPDRTISHDPYVDEFSELPWGKNFDAVFSSDVLEHMTAKQVESLGKNIRDSKARYAFMVASTRAAGKHLSNGANAHLLIKPSKWWRKKLQSALGDDFKLIMFKADLLRQDVTLCFQRPESEPQI